MLLDSFEEFAFDFQILNDSLNDQSDATMDLTDVFTITNTFVIWVALLSWPMFGRMPGPSGAAVCSKPTARPR